MKKVLIFTASIGCGHNSAAKAAADNLKRADNSVVTEITELLEEYSGKLNCLIYEKGYAVSIGSTPKLYDKGYIKLKNYCEGDGKSKEYTNMIQLSTVSMIEGVYRKINEFRPDVILCTHFFPALVVSDIRLAYNIPSSIIISNLDYNITPFWNHALNVDYITVAHEDQIPVCRKVGFDESRIAVTGIPTGAKFFGKYDKKQVRKELGLDEDMLTVLIMFGGGKWAGTHKIVKSLIQNCTRELQAVIINGSNEKSRKLIDEMDIPGNIKLVNIGYTDSVEKYMAASDIGITKAGGISTTEMINIGLPMIISQDVYGQERLNLDFLLNHGACLSYFDGADLDRKIGLCIERREELKESMKKIKRDSADLLTKLILAQPSARYDDKYIDSLDYKKVTMNCIKTLMQKQHNTF